MVAAGLFEGTGMIGIGSVAAGLSEETEMVAIGSVVEPLGSVRSAGPQSPRHVPNRSSNLPEMDISAPFIHGKNTSIPSIVVQVVRLTLATKMSGKRNIGY